MLAFHVKTVSPIFHHKTIPSTYGNGILVSFGTLVFPKQTLEENLLTELCSFGRPVTWIGRRHLSQNCSNIKDVAWENVQTSLCSGNFSMFITHGGHNSIVESLYCGVPLIVIPLNFDQLDNGYRVGYHGYGRIINLRSYKFGELTSAMHALSDQKYFQNVKQASQILSGYNLGQEEAYWELKQFVLKVASLF